MTELEDNDFLVASCLIPLTLVIWSLLYQHVPCWLFAAKDVMVVWSCPNIWPISNRLLVIFDFSESVKSVICPFLSEEMKLPNNDAHLDMGVDLCRPHPPWSHRCTSIQVYSAWSYKICSKTLHSTYLVFMGTVYFITFENKWTFWEALKTWKCAALNHFITF